MAASDCGTSLQEALRLGAASGHRRCLALGIELDAPLPRLRVPLPVEVWAPPESYLDYLFGR
jgi:hypothetical protein